MDVGGPKGEESTAGGQDSFESGCEGLRSNGGDGSSVIDCIAGGVMD